MRHPYPDVVLGDMVRELRLEAGLKVAELAKAMHWPVSRLRSLEDGSGAVTFTETTRLIRHFDLDIEEFSCAYMTTLELSHVDFREYEAAIGMGVVDGADPDYFVHD